MPPSRTLPLEFLALAAIWGSSFLFMRLAGTEFGVLPTAGARVVIGALVLLPLMWMGGHGRALRQNLGKVLFVGMLNSGIPFVLFAYAVTSITTGLSGILNATVPLFGALVVWAWLGERPDRSRVAGLVIGFAGIALLAKDSADFKPGGSGWAVVACLAAAVCYGYAATFTKRYLAGLPALANAAGSQLGASLALLVPTVWSWPSALPGAGSWAAVLVLGVLCTGMAYILYFRLIAQMGPARAVTVTYLIPLFAVVYGTLILGEAVTAWMLGCGAVVVLGTALASGVLRLPGR